MLPLPVPPHTDGANDSAAAHGEDALQASTPAERESLREARKGRRRRECYTVSAPRSVCVIFKKYPAAMVDVLGGILTNQSGVRFKVLI